MCPRLGHATDSGVHSYDKQPPQYFHLRVESSRVGAITASCIATGFDHFLFFCCLPPFLLFSLKAFLLSSLQESQIPQIFIGRFIPISCNKFIDKVMFSKVLVEAQGFIYQTRRRHLTWLLKSLPQMEHKSYKSQFSNQKCDVPLPFLSPRTNLKVAPLHNIDRN